jgi:hypothetical protein
VFVALTVSLMDFLKSTAMAITSSAVLFVILFFRLLQFEQGINLAVCGIFLFPEAFSTNGFISCCLFAAMASIVTKSPASVITRSVGDSGFQDAWAGSAG